MLTNFQPTQVKPDVLKARSLASAEVMPNGQRVILRFDDAGPAVAINPAVEEVEEDAEKPRSTRTRAAASVLGKCVERGYRKVKRVQQLSRKKGALRVELEDEAGRSKPLLLYAPGAKH